MIELKNGIRVFGHPLHPILSDFPIPLLGSALLWDLVGCFRSEALWWAISFWDISLGLGFSVLAAAAGIFDYSKIPQGHRSMGKATVHMYLMMSAVSLYAISLIVRGGAGAPEGWKLVGSLILDLIGLALLGAGGWFGGELTVKFGLGRDSATKVG